MKTLKTALSLLMVFCMLLSFGAVAFADEEPTLAEAEPAPAAAPVAEAAPESASPAQEAAPAAEVKASPAAAPAAAPEAVPAAAPADGAAATETTISNNVHVCNEANSGTYIIIGKDNYIVSKDPQTHPASGEYSTVDGNATVTVTETATEFQINGSIDASGTDENGLDVFNYAVGTETTVEVAGGVTGGTRGDKFDPLRGVYVFNQEDAGDLTVRIGGDINTGNNTENNIGIYSGSNGGNITIEVNGDVTGGSGIDVSHSSEHGSTNIIVAGDVTAESAKGDGIYVRNAGNELNITVGTAEEGGTVTGAVNLNGYNVSGSNTTVTLWETDPDTIKGDESVIKSVINYIVRLVQPDPDSNDSDVLSISATNEDGSALEKDKRGTMEVAHQGDFIKLNVNTDVGEGYEVKAYNGNEEIKPDTDGNFLYEVKLGGGVLLKAIRSLIKPEPDPQPDPQPDPEPKPVVSVIDLSAASVKCTFDLDGGTLDGETGKVIKWFVPGATVKLPGTPTKDGFTFAGWQTKVNGEKQVFEAGAKFTVTGAQSFTALWEEA